MARRGRAARGRVDPVRANAERAARAAGFGPPRRPPLLVRGGFLWWLATRLLALAVLVGAAYLVDSAATSPRFAVASVRVAGNALVSQAEVESALGLRGVNLFWVDRREAAGRLLLLAPVRAATVTPELPDTVRVQLVERQPVALWLSGNETYLVDREGVILAPIHADAPPPRACGGPPCLTVSVPDGPPLAAGDRVDAAALAAAGRLATLLPSAGIQPTAFRWSPAVAGLEVPTADGWSARFDGRHDDLERQVATLQLVRGQLAQTGVAPQLIDVRFRDRPYYR
jgi:POTRA domain, FtsQ-type